MKILTARVLAFWLGNKRFVTKGKGLVDDNAPEWIVQDPYFGMNVRAGNLQILSTKPEPVVEDAVTLMPGPDHGINIEVDPDAFVEGEDGLLTPAELAQEPEKNRTTVTELVGLKKDDALAVIASSDDVALLTAAHDAEKAKARPRVVVLKAFQERLKELGVAVGE